jgi:Immunity protein 74
MIFSRRKLKVEWVGRGLVIVRTRGKVLHVGGEALLKHDPDYVIYARYITRWEDGTLITDDDRARVLDELIDEATKRGWKFVPDRGPGSFPA